MTFIDLFSGIGGFRLGMEQAGHKCIGHCEYDKFANYSYEAMHLCSDDEIKLLQDMPLNQAQKYMQDRKQGDEWFASDIRTIRAADIPKCDCWCFGFPCQDCSVAGKQIGFTGQRSSLFFTVTTLIRETPQENKPSYLFIENVKNLLSVNRGWDFARLLIELDEIGYDAEWAALNSKNFGVPQNRERVFIVGHLRGRCTTKVFPIKPTSTGSPLDSFQSDVSGKGYKSQQDRVNTYKGIICCLPKARAITKCKVLLKDGSIRVLSARERMRCQAFPDGYTDKALLVTKEVVLCEQAGNGVTVEVIRKIAERMGVEKS